eukprot:524997-Prymnesium_polylepis.2
MNAEAIVQLLGKLRCAEIVPTAEHSHGSVLLRELKARCALQINAAIVSFGQQPLAHEHHGAVLERCDARPLERWLLEQRRTDLRGSRRLNLRHAPIFCPFGELDLELPAFDPPVGHNVGNHVLSERAVNLRVGQQQRDQLVSHDRTCQFLDAIDLLK